MYESLPNAELVDTFLSEQFKEKGVTDFHRACNYVWKLPYGRTIGSKFESVLIEGTGTCSSKHRLLKALADELKLPDIELVIGIYMMDESNTPGVGKVLDSSEFEAIPEAHCYLRYRGQRFDMTRTEVNAEQPISAFLAEISVTPEGLKEFKEPFHYQHIVECYGEESAIKVWHCREQCIAALGT